MKIQVAIPIQFLTEIEVDGNLLDKNDIEYLKDNIWENMDRTYEEVEKKMIDKYNSFMTFMKYTKFCIEDEDRNILYWIA